MISIINMPRCLRSARNLVTLILGSWVWIPFGAWINLRVFSALCDLLVYRMSNTVIPKLLITVTMKSTIFYNVTPCSLVGVYRRLGGKHCLHLQCWRLRWTSKQQARCFLLAPSHLLLTLKIEVVCSSKMSVKFYKTTRRHVPKTSTLELGVLFRW